MCSSSFHFQLANSSLCCCRSGLAGSELRKRFQQTNRSIMPEWFYVFSGIGALLFHKLNKLKVWFTVLSKLNLEHFECQPTSHPQNKCTLFQSIVKPIKVRSVITRLFFSVFFLAILSVIKGLRSCKIFTK